MKALSTFLVCTAAFFMPSHSEAKSAANNPVQHLTPVHWYIGFSNPELEIIVHAPGAAYYNYTLKAYAGVQMKSQTSGAHPDIAYIHLTIDPSTQPGSLSIQAKAKTGVERLPSFAFPYELKARRQADQRAEPIMPSDVMYLIFPDRFANGDPSNDNATTRNNEQADRGALRARHGGDLAGISQHLDYLQDLGINALWLNPVQESDQADESFHGYAITDHYRIDPRFGSNQEYLSLCANMINRGMKMVMDIIPNHPGDGHWMYLNSDTGWFHFRDSFVRSNFRAQSNHDPYADPSERLLNTDGAFVKSMPDYNQANPHMNRYFKQLYLWWIENANLAGYRIDTYPFLDQAYMNEWCSAILKEFPGFTIFGETWVMSAAQQSTYCQSRVQGYETNSLPGVTDFALAFSIHEACTEATNWNSGLSRVYQTLSEDFLYSNAQAHCTFVDNHDMARFWSVVNEDFAAWKRGISILMTTRGMPCLYYGTEILMPGKEGNGDAYYRFDFPGGWASDERNKFDPSGRSPQEKEAFIYLQTLNRYRLNNPLFDNGRFTQFSCDQNVYAAAWVLDQHPGLLNICSGDEKEQTLSWNRFESVTEGYSRWRNIHTGESGLIGGNIVVLSQETLTLELLP
ncbi:MAG: alpha-amylase family glycosyl hydrolase [Bacteroidetes bacterium]|nr:alpha-amylase family glycosyl hydrolase [Bacteroidota bacterium]MDA0942819.1 alpha-amylase family glycosyl hydrolase [Bacteroidota bacterium]MDA1111837.1 alpha-amylase family glycosyl hydrolase [Bacteroidota bacterium]